MSNRSPCFWKKFLHLFPLREVEWTPFSKNLFAYLELPPPNDTLSALKTPAALTYLPHGFEEKTKQFLICNWRIFLEFGRNFFVLLTFNCWLFSENRQRKTKNFRRFFSEVGRKTAAYFLNKHRVLGTKHLCPITLYYLSEQTVWLSTFAKPPLR